ncbi:MAG: hypothetical protein ABR912_03130 [Terracidiphilus sp.]|jgi:hypothetical protein
MKRSLALFFLILLCSQPVLANELGQFYDGEAKPRAEVAWVWIAGSGLDSGLRVSRIDRSLVVNSKLSSPDMPVVEVLPGKHVFDVSYLSPTFHAWSKETQAVEIDARAGENYSLNSDIKENRLYVKTGTFSPKAKEMKWLEKLGREVLVRSVSVDGVVQSVEANKHGNIEYLILAVPGETQPRKFIWHWDIAINAINVGQKIRVDYFPSRPDSAAAFSKVE